jgi:hypothetical protein
VIFPVDGCGGRIEKGKPLSMLNFYSLRGFFLNHIVVQEESGMSK